MAMSKPGNSAPRAQRSAPEVESNPADLAVLREQDVLAGGDSAAHAQQGTSAGSAPQPEAQEPTPAPAGREEERRLNVKFTPGAYAQLQAMAKRRGKTVSETVREALNFDLWLEEQLAQGYSLQLKRRDGATMTVAMPRR